MANFNLSPKVLPFSSIMLWLGAQEKYRVTSQLSLKNERQAYS
jgi:hypothetical protein